MDNTKKNETPWKWWPFQLSLFLPLGVAFATWLIIYLDKLPQFCFSKECLDNFIVLYTLPLKIVGVAMVLTTLSLAYYRAKLTFEQHERQLIQDDRQLKQDEINSYQFLKASFKDLLHETEEHLKFDLLKINSEWLFNSLYPDSQKGNTKLVDGIVYELLEELPEYYNSLSAKLAELTTDNFYTKQYSDIYDIYNRISEIIPISQKRNFIESNSCFFYQTNENENLITLLIEITELAKIINAFHGWKWFSYKETLSWLEVTEKIASNMKSADIINNNIRDISKKEIEVINWIDSPSHMKPHSLRMTKIFQLAEKSEIQRIFAYEILLSQNSRLTTEEKYHKEIRLHMNIPTDYSLSTYLTGELIL